MTSVETRPRSASPVTAPEGMHGIRVLVVSEDPYFLDEASIVLGYDGVRVVGCLGPAHTACELYVNGSCPLTMHSDVVLVDSPKSGEFRYRLEAVPAGKYAEDLQRRHVGAHVLLCGAPIGRSGPTGEVSVLEDRREALFIITRFLRTVRAQQLEDSGATTGGGS